MRRIGKVRLAFVTFCVIMSPGFWTNTVDCSGWWHGVPPREFIITAPDGCLATLHVSAAAQVSKVSYSLDENALGNKPALHFLVFVRNVSGAARRYKVSVSVLGGPSEAQVCPQEKAEFLNPGEEKSCIVPMEFNKNPDSVTITVEALPRGIFEACVYFVKRLVNNLLQWSVPQEEDVTEPVRIYRDL